MTTSDASERFRQRRAEFWGAIGTIGETRRRLGELDEGSLWPSGSSSYLRVTTAHAGIIATDGLSDPTGADGSGARPGLGLELYIEGVELLDDDPATGRWLMVVLEEAAGAVAGAWESVGDALVEHGLLSLELPGTGAPQEWLAHDRLGALIGVELPGRPTGFDVDGAPVRVLSVTPLRPSELAVITQDGAVGRRRVADALSAAGWYSYADTDREAVL